MTRDTTLAFTRVLDAAFSRPVHGVAATRRLEAAAHSATEPHALMARAGLAVAKLAAAVAPHARQVDVLCGGGNNGGDGMEAAFHLHRAGRDVRVSLLGDAARLPPDAAWSLQRAQEAGVPITPALPDALRAGLAIDALLGIGANRPPDGALAEAVRRLGDADATVLAVDLPSGLDPATGALLGAAAVRARHTLSLLALQPGLFMAQGRDHAGEIWLSSLGLEPAAVEPLARLAGADLALGALPARRHAQHKGSFGDVLVVAGAAGMAGAGLLAGRAASAAGAGRVFLDLIDPDAPPIDPQHPELMVRAGARHDAALLARATVVCGCGGGTALAALLPPLLAAAPRLVLDADALNALAGDPDLQQRLRLRLALGRATLLTPHPLEAARLLGSGVEAVQRDRLAGAQALADGLACAVLLKGSGSVVAAPGVLPWINPTGNALLATAGTGDVLAGWLGGLWAQAPLETPQTVGAVGAFRHGHAADRALAAGRTDGWRASDLIDALQRPI